MKEVIDVLKNTYSMYNNTSQYYAMGSYIVLLVIALIWYLCNKEKINKSSKNIFEYSGIPLTILKDGKLNTSDDIYLIKNMRNWLKWHRNKESIFGNMRYSLTLCKSNYK